MFEKLIESNSAGAAFKPRRKFFMMSSIVVAILFLGAVVLNLYAKDLDLGTENFELSQLLAPVAHDAPQPDPVRQQPRQSDQQEMNVSASHPRLIASIDQTPKTPVAISTTPFIGDTHFRGKFNFDPNGPDTHGIGVNGPPSSEGGTPSFSTADTSVTEVARAPEPPPVVKTVPKPPVVKSEGVINGKATYLPTPAYPAPAKMVGAYGVVNVQVTIDEQGNVMSAKAVSGHPLLRGTAESAAWKARFSPTYLSRVPVKVTGVIVFNFKKS